MSRGGKREGAGRKPVPRKVVRFTAPLAVDRSGADEFLTAATHPEVLAAMPARGQARKVEQIMEVEMIFGSPMRFIVRV